MLRRLPGTAGGLSIALALQADPSNVLLGKQANEDVGSGFKILTFATHGLVPKELSALTRPALALWSPKVTGQDGDCLLESSAEARRRLGIAIGTRDRCGSGRGSGLGSQPVIAQGLLTAGRVPGE
jgi:hypothetical protein